MSLWRCFAGNKKAVVGAHVCAGGKMNKARKVEQTLRASSSILQEQGKSLMTNLPDDGNRGDVMQSAVIEWGGSEMEIVFDPLNPPTIENFDKAVFLTYKSAEALLQWRPNSAREKVASKSLKASQGEGLTLGKKSVTDSAGRKNEMGVMDFETFHRIVQWQGFDRGNKAAQAMLAAGYRDSIRSLSLEQINGVRPSVENRNRQIEADRKRFYEEYAAGITDEEWIAGSASGQAFLGSIKPGSLTHQILFSKTWTPPQFLVSAVLSGQDPLDVLEEMRVKYEGR